MYGFILTGHGHFSNGLKSAIDMVAGEVPAFQIVPFEGAEAGAYGDKLREAVEAMRAECDGVLILVDLLGGTPFNQGMMLTQQIDNVEVVAGTNLPMLIVLIMTRGNASSLTELAEQAVAVGQAGVCHKVLTPVADDDDDDDL